MTQIFQDEEDEEFCSYCGYPGEGMPQCQLCGQTYCERCGDELIYRCDFCDVDEEEEQN